MGKIHKAVSLGGIQTMLVHRFKEGGSGPIGMLVLEQDCQLLEPLQLCSGDMIMRFNGQGFSGVTQPLAAGQVFGQEGAAQEKYTQLQVLRTGKVIDLFID